MGQNELPRIRVSFVITGSNLTDPIILDSILSVTHSKITRQCDIQSSIRPIIRLNEWIFSTDYIRSDNLEDVIVLAIVPFLDKELELANFVIPNQLDVVVVCVIEIYSDRPLFDLSSDLVKNLAKLNASIRYDIYDYSGGEE